MEYHKNESLRFAEKYDETQGCHQGEIRSITGLPCLQE